MEREVKLKLLSESLMENQSERWLIKQIWIESKKFWGLAGPATLTRVTMFGIFMISLAFIGHIGTREMAAFSLIFHVLARFSVGLLIGMSSALDSLCSQAFATKQYHMLGIYLQRSWIVEFGFSLILVPIFVFSSPILKFLGQTDEISEMSTTLSLWYIPIMYSSLFSYTLQMFLQAQKKNMIITWLAPLSFILHGLISWILVQELGLGVQGAMISMVISSWLPVVCQLLYIFCGGCPSTWTGFSWLAFCDLWPLVNLSVFSCAILCLELWYNSVLIVVIGNMKNAEVGVNFLSICITVNGLEFMLSSGFLAAASARVQNELANGSTKAAKFSVLVALSTSLVFGVSIWALILGYRHKFPYIFSCSDDVADAFANFSLLLVFPLCLNSVQPILSGVAIGSGWRTVVPCINISCYYLVGLPLGISIAYFGHLAVKGIWMGMMGGTMVQTSILIYFTCKTDWDKQVCVAQAQMNKWIIQSQHDSSADLAHDMPKA